MNKNSDPVLYKSFLTAQECHSRGDLAGAEAIYSRLLTIDPADDEVLFLFGYLQAGKGAIDLGLQCLQMARQLKPSNPRIPYTMGVVLQQAGRLGEAVTAYRAALGIDPNYREALENLCTACYDREDFVSALDAAQRALAIDPASVLAIRGVANSLTALGRRAEALTVLNEGIHRHPAHPELRIHHAWELLANGDLVNGWRALEWRDSRLGVFDAPPRSVPFPRWNGEPLAGKTVLVYGEQGVGDEIMYAPYVLGIIAAGGSCILECEPRLEHLFARAFPQCTLLRREESGQIPWHASLPQIDFCISVLSLPLYFDHPLERGAYLSADSARVAYWRQRLQAAGPGLKIGISWRGGASAKVRKIRSIPPGVFGGLIDSSATFVSLQYGATPEEIAAVSPQLQCFAEIDPLRDLDEFAALVAALDVVVSIDNSTVHLAGALGVKTLLLLPVYAEWRWGPAASGESPWYQSVELVRQREATDSGWQEALISVKKRLDGLQPVQAGKNSTGDDSAAIIYPAKQGRSALLVADTHYWYHWGCTCSSLGMHEGLRQRFDTIRVLPLSRLLAGCPQPTAVDNLDADDFFRHFEERCPDIATQIQAADCVIINGEDSVFRTQPLKLFLFYLAYVAVRRYGKRVALINHSTEPSEVCLTGMASADAYRARVYGVLEVVASDAGSLDYLRQFNPEVQLGFDCLPRFLMVHSSGQQSDKNQRKLVLGGSPSWTAEMVACFVRLAAWMHGKGYAVEILSGAKALLAAEEIAFVEVMAAALRQARIEYAMHFPLSEAEWLEAIGSADLLASGHFHYCIAAAFKQVPFLATGNLGGKTSRLLGDLGLDPDVVALAAKDYGKVVERARKLLQEGTPSLASQERLDELLIRTEQNFVRL